MSRNEAEEAVSVVFVKRTHKTKNRVTPTPLKPKVKTGASEG
jgi:hypothetical protein